MTTKTILAGLALAALGATAASAADLPRRGSAPAPAPVYAKQGFSWTGAYVGAHAGYGWGRHTKSGRGFYNRTTGGLVGVTAGYNQQHGAIVAGVEGDIAAADIKGSGAAPGPVTGRSRISALGTARARIGVAADRLLVYGTGGYAGAQVKNSLVDTPRGLAYSQGKWLNGYAVGAGAEYAVTDNITAKAEYLYADLGKKTYFAAPNAMPTGMRLSTVRGGVNYKF